MGKARAPWNEHLGLVENLDRGLERLVHRASGGDLWPPLTLILGQLPHGLDAPGRDIELSLGRLALPAILCIGSFMGERDSYVLKRPTFPLGIHAQGDGLAGTKHDQKQLVGARSLILATQVFGLSTTMW